MFTTKQLAMAAPYIYYGASIAAALANGIGIHKSLASNGGTGLTGDPLLARLAAAIIIFGYAVFWSMVWLACTIVDPKTNHIGPCLIGWIWTSVAPATALIVWVSLTGNRTQTKESTKEENKQTPKNLPQPPKKETQ